MTDGRNRPWRQASLRQIAPRVFEVRLDGRKLRLAHGLELHLSGPDLAEAVREEWQQAAGMPDLVPQTIGLTRLAATLQHQIAPHRPAAIAALAAMGQDDLLRYRAPDPLLAEEQRAWDEVLDWLEATHALRLTVTTGIRPLPVEPGEGERWQQALGRIDDVRLTALGVLTPLLGSLTLALALLANRLAPAEALDLSRLDETHQARRWGTDAAHHETRARLAADIALVRRFVALATIESAANGQADNGCDTTTSQK